MSLQQVVPGKYEAFIKDWGVREVEKMDNKLECYIAFDFRDQAGQPQTISFKQFVQTKDGRLNKKVLRTLDACGYKHADLANEELDLIPFLDSDALDKTVPVDITVIDKVAKDGRTFKEIEWVNKKSDAAFFDRSEKTIQTLKERLVASGLGKSKPRPKNYAPGANGQDDDNPLPF